MITFALMLGGLCQVQVVDQAPIREVQPLVPHRSAIKLPQPSRNYEAILDELAKTSVPRQLSNDGKTLGIWEPRLSKFELLSGSVFCQREHLRLRITKSAFQPFTTSQESYLGKAVGAGADLDLRPVAILSENETLCLIGAQSANATQSLSRSGVNLKNNLVFAIINEKERGARPNRVTRVPYPFVSGRDTIEFVRQDGNLAVFAVSSRAKKHKVRDITIELNTLKQAKFEPKASPSRLTRFGVTNQPGYKSFAPAMDVPWGSSLFVFGGHDTARGYPQVRWDGKTVVNTGKWMLLAASPNGNSGLLHSKETNEYWLIKR